MPSIPRDRVEFRSIFAGIAFLVKRPRHDCAANVPTIGNAICELGLFLLKGSARNAENAFRVSGYRREFVEMSDCNDVGGFLQSLDFRT